MNQNSISHKTQRVLMTLLILFALIFFRIWQLTVIERDEMEQKARRPKRRWLVERPERGTIHDRYGMPLAINRICYNACIYYGNISGVPRILWKTIDGIRIKTYPRREHIEKLSELIAKELDLDPLRVEDLIHSKASLFPHVPFIIKKNITEKEYYRLRMLERKWPGLHAESASERFYPHGKVASDILGYMGAIGQNEYFSIAKEIKELNRFFQECRDGENPLLPIGCASIRDASNRLTELKSRAYSIHDSIGKYGVEAKFEEYLRGSAGYKTFEVDVKGNFLRELAGSKSQISGKKITLNISLELQKYAEELLIEDEKTREGRSYVYDSKLQKRIPLKQPWIKGGAIVAMDPNTGEILALATNPRFDPNDFLPSAPENAHIRNSHIHHWLETERHIANIYDGKETLDRECFSEKTGLQTEKLKLSWKAFLNFILPNNSPIFQSLPRTLKRAIELQEDISFLLYYSGQKNALTLFHFLFPQDKASLDPLIANEIQENLSPHTHEVSKILEKWRPLFAKIKSNADKVFLIDLCRLSVFSPAFSDELIEKVGYMTTDDYFSLSQEVHCLEARAKKMTTELFHTLSFIPWRKENMKEYLKEMREKEKERKTYARPYIDYLDKMEKELFNTFWEKNRLQILTCYLKGDEASFENSQQLRSYYTYFLHRSKKDQNRSDTINLQNFSKKINAPLLLDFINTVRSFDRLDRKLYFQSNRLRAKKGHLLEKHLAAAFYPTTGFGYGRSFAFRQSTPLGSIFKIITSCAALKKRIQELPLAPKSMFELNPFEMVDETRWESKVGKNGSLVVGYTLNRKPYPRFYKGGRLPKSSHRNMGRLDLISAIERSSNPYFALLAGDYLDSPDELLEMSREFNLGSKTGIDLSGEIRGNLPNDLYKNRTGLYSFAIGQHSLIATPLQTSLMLSTIANQGTLFKPQIVKQIEGNQRSNNIFSREHIDFAFQDELRKLGFTFPILFAKAEDRKEVFSKTTPEILRELEFPPQMKEILLSGLHRVTSSEKGSARAQIIKGFLQNPALLKEYKDSGYTFVGKTSTAEIMHNPYIHPSSRAQIYKHIWFGGISFHEHKTKQETWDDPELVVIVFLRFGDAGKEAAPLAYKVVKKFREIKDFDH